MKYYVQNVYDLEWSASSEAHFAHTLMFGGCKVTFGFWPLQLCVLEAWHNPIFFLKKCVMSKNGQLAESFPMKYTRCMVWALTMAYSWCLNSGALQPHTGCREDPTSEHGPDRGHLWGVHRPPGGAGWQQRRRSTLGPQTGLQGILCTASIPPSFCPSLLPPSLPPTPGECPYYP